MTPAEKRTFITDLCNNIRDDVLGRAEAMPEEWDGLELRQYLADKFADSANLHHSDQRRRLRAYRNEVAVNGAL